MCNTETKSSSETWRGLFVQLEILLSGCFLGVGNPDCPIGWVSCIYLQGCHNKNYKAAKRRFSVLEEDRALGRVCFASQRSKWERVGCLFFEKAEIFGRCISLWGNRNRNLINSWSLWHCMRNFVFVKLPRNRWLPFIRFSKLFICPSLPRG